MALVRWFFIVGGFLFLVAALVVREWGFEGSDVVAATFITIGGFWVAPQLLMMLRGSWLSEWRAQRRAR